MMNNISPLTSLEIPRATQRDGASNVVASEENPWVQAGFCDEKGKLTYEPRIQSLFLNYEALNKLEKLFQKTIRVDKQVVTIRRYLDHVLSQFPHFSFELCLRGSYAAYIFNPLDALRALVNEFIEIHPDKRLLMLAGMKRVEDHFPPPAEPNDADWTLLGNIPLSPEQQLAVREGLIRVHAELAKVSLEEAESRTFQSLFIPHSTRWTDLDDPIVISTVEGDEIKVDLVTGFLQKAPYLFSYDNRLIRMGHNPYIKVLNGSLFQASLDFGLNVIRFEKRHKKDLRALLKALHYLTNGKTWDESEITAKKIFSRFLHIPPKEMAEFVLKWLGEKNVDRISFVVNLLCLVDDVTQREELWKHLSDGKIPFADASRQIYHRIQAFPESYGAIPLLTMTEGPVNPSIDFMKRALFLPLRKHTSNPSGIYAEWRHCCELLNDNKPVPQEFIDQIASMYLANKFTESEASLLAGKLFFPTLIDAFIALGTSKDVHASWLQAHQHETWDERLKQLPMPIHPATKTFLIAHCSSDNDPKELFLCAFRHRIFQAENQTRDLFVAITKEDREDAVITFIGKVATHVSAEDKEWIIDLWISCMQYKRISLSAFNARIPRWFNGKITDQMKQRIALKIIHAVDISSLDALEALTPYLVGAEREILMQSFLKILEKSSVAASLFFRYHQDMLTAYLDDLFLEAAEKQIAISFMNALTPLIDMRSLILTNLSKISSASRLTCAQHLPQSDQMQCLKDPQLLPGNDRTTLGLKIVNENKSLFDLWILQSWGIHLPERFVHTLLQSFYPKQNLKGGAVQQSTHLLIDSLHIDALELIVTRLEPSLKEEMQPIFRARMEQSLTQNHLGEIAAVLKCKELTEWAQLTPQDLETLKIAHEQCEELYKIVIEIKRPSPLYFVLCSHYIRLMPDAYKNNKLCNLMFSWAPHQIPSTIANLLVSALTANPQQYAKAFIAHATWLMRMIDSKGETFYHLLTIYIDLGLALPADIPQAAVEHMLTIPFDQKTRAVAQTILRRVYIPSLFEHFLRNPEPDHPVVWDDVQAFSIPDARILDPLFNTEASIRKSLPSLLHFSQKGRAAIDTITAFLESVMKRCLAFQASDLILDNLDLIERSIKNESLRKEIAQLAIQRYLTEHRRGYHWFKYVDSIETASEILCVYRKHDLEWHRKPEAVRALIDIIRHVAKNSVHDEHSAVNYNIAKHLIVLIGKCTELTNVHEHPEVLQLFTLYTHHQSWSDQMHASLLLIIANIAPEGTAKSAFIELIRLLSCGLILSPDKWKLLVPLQYRFKNIILPPIFALAESQNEPDWEDVKEEYFYCECLIRFILQQNMHTDEFLRKEDFCALLAWARLNHHLHEHLEIYADIISLEILRDLPGTGQKMTIALTPDSMGLINFWLNLRTEPNISGYPLAIIRDRFLANTSFTKFEMILQFLCQITRNEFEYKHKNQALFERDYKELLHALFAHPHFRLEKHLVASIQSGLSLFKKPMDIFFYTLFLTEELKNKRRIIEDISMNRSREEVYALLTRAIDIAHRRLDQTGFIWSHYIVVHVCHNFPKNKDRVKPFLNKILNHLRLRNFKTEEFEKALASAFGTEHYTTGMESWMRNLIDKHEKEPLPELIPLTAKDFLQQ